METSILKSTKKILGLADDYTAFDLDVTTHINTAFATLAQVGVGPVEGFAIEDDSTEWSSYLQDLSQLNQAKNYVYLKVRMIFDPPATSYLIAAFEKQLEETIWRINILREGTEWVDPDPPVVVT